MHAVKAKYLTQKRARLVVSMSLIRCLRRSVSAWYIDAHGAMHAAKMLMRTRLALPMCLIGWALSLVACSLMAPKFERPTLSVGGIELVSGNLLQQRFRVKFNIQNPNDRALPVSGLHASLSVGGEHIAQGWSDRAFVVPARGDADFDMMITANIGLALLKLANKRDQHADAIDYDLQGAASIELPFLRDLPFHQTGSLSLKGLQ
jgi:LEA14-like dessication related protein